MQISEFPPQIERIAPRIHIDAKHDLDFINSWRCRQLFSRLQSFVPL